MPLFPHSTPQRRGDGDQKQEGHQQDPDETIISLATGAKPPNDLSRWAVPVDACCRSGKRPKADFGRVALTAF